MRHKKTGRMLVAKDHPNLEPFLHDRGQTARGLQCERRSARGGFLD